MRSIINSNDIFQTETEDERTSTILSNEYTTTTIGSDVSNERYFASIITLNNFASNVLINSCIQHINGYHSPSYNFSNQRRYGNDNSLCIFKRTIENSIKCYKVGLDSIQAFSGQIHEQNDMNSSCSNDSDVTSFAETNDENNGNRNGSGQSSPSPDALFIHCCKEIEQLICSTTKILMVQLELKFSPPARQIIRSDIFYHQYYQYGLLSRRRDLGDMVKPFNFSFNFSNLHTITNMVRGNNAVGRCHFLRSDRCVIGPIIIDEYELLGSSTHELDLSSSIFLFNIAASFQIQRTISLPSALFLPTSPKDDCYHKANDFNANVSSLLISHKVYLLAYDFIQNILRQQGNKADVNEQSDIQTSGITSQIEYLHLLSISILILNNLISLSMNLNEYQWMDHFMVELNHKYADAVAWLTKATQFFGNKLIRQTAGAA